MENIEKPLSKFAIYFSLYFTTVSAHIVNNETAQYFDMILTYIFRTTPVLSFILSVTSLLIANFIYYGMFYFIGSIISCFSKQLVEVRAFCYKFGWYLAALQLFDTFIPLVPINLFNVMYAIIGVPVHCHLFALFQSSLPDIYIRLLFGIDLVQIESMKFTADLPYLFVVLFAIGMTLAVCIFYSMYLFVHEEPTRPDPTEPKEPNTIPDKSIEAKKND
ncbi:hypothetical protein EHI_087000 [Entamoeba histolytica HM-1:IMSS]|uniref:Uncharacterized protein n=4 Tax=Entamoeba histolytica TaxID=5759 RepID=B1N5H8_ENTH1|nr:hypothetical protein EHI_087000 [Entamoeba histolytica HM-1:IMSS]EDS88780.1 hypothetical protein EHI_087000 [Entamoeba histolytica HM-1:IMSS]EMD49796.1 Hypothetical protein EHI5A_273630 [Entamoeba histolytica KU27]|eukprot:XP_001914444.1 hypothetical protein EHI_087000 [Entamoeba histolytica HM-1:IMSS]